jgi:HAD superfamily hydrolase (TIGR01509 family)
MARFEALLLDAYQTIMHTDFRPYAGVLPTLAGVPAEQFYAAYARVAPLVTTGENTRRQAFAETLTMCGVVPRPELTRQLAVRARELLLSAGQLYDDVLPFLRSARAHGVKVAIVSNCDENTRDLLGQLGVTPLVDELVLSCEVRSAKPSPKIYKVALRRLRVKPGAALFVDDSARFCAAAQARGVSAVRIARGAEPEPVPGLVTVRGLAAVGPLLWGGGLVGEDRPVEGTGAGGL